MNLDSTISLECRTVKTRSKTSNVSLHFMASFSGNVDLSLSDSLFY